MENSFKSILLYPSSFLLLLAPPGWGKTSLLINLYKNTSLRLVYLSPLRALAEEFYERIENLNNVHILRHNCEWQKKKQIFLNSNKGFLLLTPELITYNLIKEIKKSNSETVFVLDEFHLFYYWGEGFREKLFEVCIMLGISNMPILALSATMSNRLLDKFKRDFSLCRDNLFVLNVGNCLLKNNPKQIFFFNLNNKFVFIRRFKFLLFGRNKGIILYFCRYRHEVKNWVEYCGRFNINVLGCVGGETKAFRENLKKTKNIKCIFATTALSHGVNLPEISRVFLGYEVCNKDFFIQMAGRGGRFGGDFELYHFDKFFLKNKIDRYFAFLKNIIFDMFVVKMLLPIRTIECKLKLKDY